MSPAPIVPILPLLTPKRIARFWSRVDKRGPDECWPWRARRTPQGYGAFDIEEANVRRQLLAHRVAKVFELGRDPDAPLLRHKCHNPACCNPAHLVEGAHADNFRDAVLARRMPEIPFGGAHFRRGAAHPAADFDDEVRQRAVRLYYTDNVPMQEIAYTLGCHRQSVARWLRDYRNSFLTS